MSFSRQFDHSEQLFEAALAEFTAVGYEPASINTILKNAGMSKGQFYHHFGSKEGVYLALIEILIARKQAFLASVMQPEDLQQDIFSIFKTQIQYGIAFARDYPAINTFAQSFLKEKGTPIYEKAMARFNFDQDQALHHLIATAYQNGEFREELPLTFVQKTVTYLFNHVADLTEISSTDDAKEHLNYLVEFMRSGLGRQSQH